MSERRNQAESSIESVNELGGIRIKCCKLTMESGKNLGLESAKGTELTSEEEMGIKTKKDATHMQLPGTIQFQQGPKKEGEVTGGTSGKVKIDGKEAAVIGSTVTTCNDIGARDNSTIIAVGASMPMPTIINPLNAEEWTREREEEEEKRPEFQNVKWSKTSAEEGEEVELSAGVKDMADGSMVTLQVFPEGKGPEDGAAYARLPVTVKSGTASARWSHRADRREIPPEENPRFIFTAHSAWCNFARSSNSLEVKLRRPEITKAEWRDADGNAASKGLVGELLKLHAETRDFDEGQGVTLTVRNAATGEEVFQTGAEVRDGIAEAEWKPIDTRQSDDTRELKYTLEATGNRCKKTESGECQVRNPRVVSMEWGEDFAYPSDTISLKIKSLEMKDFNYSGLLNFYDKQKFSNSEPLFTETISIYEDEKEIEIELPVDKLNMSYKDESGFAKLCAEIVIKDIGYSYVEKETLDILIDFGRD